MVSPEYIRECFEYDGNTGALVWKVRPTCHFKNIGAAAKWNGKFPGKLAGGINTVTGYRYVAVNKQKIAEHRVIWAFVHARWPSHEIDHINSTRNDNRIANLRECDGSQNKHRSLRQNKSGTRGAYWCKRRLKWVAQIRVNGKQTNLGGYDCIAAASFAYQIAADKQFGDYARPL